LGHGQSPAITGLHSALAAWRRVGDGTGVQSLKAFDRGLPPLGVAGRSALLSSIISVVRSIAGALTASSLAVFFLVSSTLSGDLERDRFPVDASTSMAVDEAFMVCSDAPQAEVRIEKVMLRSQEMTKADC
jgi:hypothetical protein